MAEVQLKRMEIQEVTVSVKGTTPLVTHAWSEKAKRTMRDKHGGKKTKSREVRNPKAEHEAAKYFTDDGVEGIPAMAFKSALITAAHKDIGIEKTLVRKAVFLKCEDSGMVLPITYEESVMREDCVRVGSGSTDLRYRPEYRGWQFQCTLQVDAELIKIEDLLALVDRAGFGVGIGEMRPEKGGEYGRFSVDQNVDTVVKEV